MQGTTKKLIADYYNYFNQQDMPNFFALLHDEIIHDARAIARLEGLLIAPEGAALYSALKKLLTDKTIQRSEKVLLLNTGSGYKYLDGMRNAELCANH